MDEERRRGEFPEKQKMDSRDETLPVGGQEKSGNPDQPSGRRPENAAARPIDEQDGKKRKREQDPIGVNTARQAGQEARRRQPSGALWVEARQKTIQKRDGSQ